MGRGKRVLRRVCEWKERRVRVTEVEGGAGLPRRMEGGQNARLRDLQEGWVGVCRRMEGGGRIQIH